MCLQVFDFEGPALLIDHGNFLHDSLKGKGGRVTGRANTMREERSVLGAAMSEASQKLLE